MLPLGGDPQPAEPEMLSGRGGSDMAPLPTPPPVLSPTLAGASGPAARINVELSAGWIHRRYGATVTPVSGLSEIRCKMSGRARSRPRGVDRDRWWVETEGRHTARVDGLMRRTRQVTTEDGSAGSRVPRRQGILRGGRDFFRRRQLSTAPNAGAAQFAQTRMRSMKA